MAVPIGGLSVYFEDDTARFQSGMRANAALVEQQAGRINRSLGGVAKSVDDLNRKSRSFEPDAFRALAVSALRAQNNVERLRLSMLAVGALAGGGFAGAFALKTLTDTADRYTNIQNKIAAVVSDSRVRASVEQQIFDISQRTRTGYEATAQLYQRLTLSASALGAKQGEILTVVELTAKALQTAGATSAEANSAATQLSQALGAGRLQGDELRSILENAPVLAQAIAKEFNVSVGELKEMGANGELLSSKVFRAILNSAGSINEQFDRMRPTVGQAITVLDNAFTRFIGRMDQSLGASTALANGIISLATNFHTFGDAVVYAGTGLAAFLISRRAASAIQGTIVDPFRAERGRRFAAVDDAKAGVDEAKQAAQQTAVNRKNADFAAREFMNQPAFKQASTQVQAEFERAAVAVDKAQQKAAEAGAKHIALLEKRVELEQKVGSVGTAAANSVDRARAATMGREERYNRLLEERAALEAKAQGAGTTVSRANQQQFYNELGKEIAAREKLQALRVERLDMRDALRTARETVANTQGTQDHAAALKQLATVEERLTGIERERFAALNALHRADQAQQKINATLAAAQASEQERAANALAQHDAKIARAAQSHAEARENEARRVVAALKTMQAEHEKHAAALQRLDQQIIGARQGRDARLGEVATAQRGLGAAAGAVLPSAAAGVAGFQQQRLQAVVQEGEAIARAASAQTNYAAAVAKSAAGSSALGAAMGLVAGAGRSIMAFLGGPLGVALTAVTAGWALYEIATARSAAKTEEARKAVEMVSSALERLAESQKSSGGSIMTSVAELNALAATIGGQLPGQLTTLQRQFSAIAFQMKDMSGFEAIAGLSREFTAAQKNGTVTVEMLERVITALTNLAATNIDLGPQANALLVLAKAARDAQSALTNVRRETSLARAGEGEFDDARDAQIRRTRAEEARRNLAAGKAIDAFVGENLPPDAGIPKEVGAQIEKKVSESVEKGAKTGWELFDRAIELQKQNPGLTLTQARAIAKREDDIAQESKKKEAKTDEERLADRIQRVTEEAKAGFFTPLDKELIEELAKIKGSAELTKQTRQALETGQALPKEAQELRSALAVKAAAKEYQSIVEKYGTIAQILPHVQNEQEKLNLLLKMGKIDTEQYGLALADYLAKFQQFKWIDDLSTSVKGFGDSLIDNFLKGTLTAKTFGAALLDLGQNVAKLALQRAAVEPLVNLLKSGLGSLATSLLPGNTTSTFPTLSPAEPPIRPVGLHGGGVVGRDATFHRTVPLSAFAGAERFHRGRWFGAREIPAILERNERVLTARQNRGLEGMLAGGTGGGGARTVVNNFGSSQVETRDEGGTTIIDVFDAVEARHANRVASGFGPLSKAVHGGRSLRG